MIPPHTPRTSDIPDFTEAAPLVFTSRRKAGAETARPTGRGYGGPAVVAIVAAALSVVALVWWLA